MDNYIDNLGEPDESQEQPQQTEDTPDVVEPEDTPDVVEPEETPPVIELEETPAADSFTEPKEQPATPEIPEGPSKDDRMWATFCHLAAFAGYVGVPFGQILGPLIIWLIKREDCPFVDQNGKKALNFQISIAIYMLASTPLICGGPLILLAIVPLMIVDVIFTIIAAIKANNGEEVSYPISIEFIK